MEVAIIGAGISGLGAAFTLVESGFKRITIYEAQDYIGGRIKSLNHDEGFLELGAQWVHGQENNLLYEMASQRELITTEESFEGTGHFCTQYGSRIDSRLVDQVLMFLDSVKVSLSNDDYKLDGMANTEAESDPIAVHVDGDSESLPSRGSSISVGEIFRMKFNQWIEAQQFKSSEETKLCQGIYNWFIKFESIDNACTSLDQLSVISYSLYHECEGVPLNNFKTSYSTFIQSLLTSLPEVALRTSCPISKIIYPSSGATDRVTLICSDGSTAQANHVIVTSSLGFLRHEMDSFFEPPLPPSKRSLISALGYDTVNKIYLIFEKPFWSPQDLGFQLIWLDHHPNLKQYPSWVHDISGIDTVAGQSKVLVGWIGGKGAESIERETDSRVINVFHSLLVNFLSPTIPESEITKPVKIVRTFWHSNDFFRGSYSHRTVSYAKLNLPIAELSKALTIPHSSSSRNQDPPIEWPLVLFAGEATDERHFSTTHGALESGVREARKLLKFWRDNQIAYEEN